MTKTKMYAVITPIATIISAQEPTKSNSSDPQKRFVGSRGFVDKFCARYAIKNQNKYGEKLSSNVEAVEPFLAEMEELRKLYTLDQIY